MRILIDGKPVATLTARHERDLSLAKAEDSIEGSILSTEDATADFLRRTRLVIGIVGSVALVLMLGIAIGVTVDDGIMGSDRQVGQVGGIVGAGLVVAMLWLALRYRTRKWNNTLDKRREGMPPAGTAIRLDAAGLAVATQHFAWPALALEQVEIAIASSGPDSGSIYLVQRLSLASPGGPIVLDKAMLGNGNAIVDNVWRRLRPPRQSK